LSQLPLPAGQPLSPTSAPVRSVKFEAPPWPLDGGCSCWDRAEDSQQVFDK
jgi:hypothetical protein